MAQQSKRICVLVLGSSLLVGYGSIGLAAKQKSKPPEVSVTQGFSQDRLRRIAPVMQDQFPVVIHTHDDVINEVSSLFGCGFVGGRADGCSAGGPGRHRHTQPR